MKQKVLLIGWDAADWKVISPLVDKGLMPNLSKLVETGVMGNLATLSPIYSPMLWTSIATGKRPYKHGIHGFAEPDYENNCVRPITNLSRNTKAIWNILNQENKKSHIVGWWPSSPAEPINGSMISNHFQQAVAPLGKPWPMRPGTIHPLSLQEELAPLRVHPHEIEGDMLRSFVPNAPDIDQEKDKRLETVAKIFAECTGIHSAVTHLMGHASDWDFTAVYYDAIDHFGHAFQKYHPPKLDWVSEEDFELYKGVVEGGYIYHDMMLGTLIELAGPETTVMLISDHGFHPDHLRPQSTPNEPAGPAAEHREFGIFVASGPGIKKDDLVFGASLLDITPTILSLFDLPVGLDMDGNILQSIFKSPKKIEPIESWDSVEGNDGRHPEDFRVDLEESKESVQQLVDLGYIDEPDEDSSKAMEETDRELNYNLSIAYIDGGLHQEAQEILTTLWEKWPEETRFGVRLLQSLIETDQISKARKTMSLLRTRKKEAIVSAKEEIKETISSLIEKQNKSKDDEVDWETVDDKTKRKIYKLRRKANINPHAFSFLEGSLLAKEGHYEKAIEALENALQIQTSNLPSLHQKIGDTHLEARCWDLAKSSYEKVLEINSHHHMAHVGIARVAIRQENWDLAIEHGSTALGIVYHHSVPHYLIGLALWKKGDANQAEAQFRKAIEINPNDAQANRILSQFLFKEKKDWQGSIRHQKLARKARLKTTAQKASLPADSAQAEPITFNTTLSKRLDDYSSIKNCVIVVTGLPRSGTSMLMQILANGGLEIFADEDHRPADQSNLKGYYEHDSIKSLVTDSNCIKEAKGKAVKVVTPLIPHLPDNQFYLFLMVHRPIKEIIASQTSMLTRLDKKGGELSEGALEKNYSNQVSKVRKIISTYQKNNKAQLLDISYHDALKNPLSVCKQIADFLDTTFDAKKASLSVDASLYRERLAE